MGPVSALRVRYALANAWVECVGADERFSYRSIWLFCLIWNSSTPEAAFVAADLTSDFQRPRGSIPHRTHC